ncbi:phosphate acetyltransferase [Corynebacterium sp. P5875]|uniref:Phosphate acetyltransferase n=1 Tax=Corynebacterium antarcticum TaxID=2800405 RepID=A0A9Q4CFS3_9CORY|nr:phosphate acetyltransferase [Corynebacterium antarcticum]MCX7538827.1 phosphate acetyltransferase [Corynebacterium antarcticum]
MRQRDTQKGLHVTSSPRPVLLTAAGRNLNGIDTAPLAEHLGLEVRPLIDGEVSVSAVIGSDPLGSGAALLVGTGSIDFDSRCAAALGVPLLIATGPDSTLADLAVAEAEARGASVVTLTDPADGAALDAAASGLRAAAPEPVMSPALFEHWLLGQARAKRTHIVLPEGEDDRILTAAHQLLAEDVCELTILGDVEDVRRRAADLGLDLSAAHLVDHLTDPDAEVFAEEFAELRKAKGVTLEQARETMRDISYYATMMIHTGRADGMVSGAAHTTAHTIKPSLQIIKTAPGVSFVSSIFLMVLQGRLWSFGDCAVMPNPTAAELGEIAVVSARTAAQFGIDPKVAVLSYSTGSSGSGEDVDRATRAVASARELDPSVAVDGPLQFDAAVDAGVAKKKMPESTVAGRANVLVFPDLEAGNIAYKAVQRTADALAVGPVLQGLKKPVNDLSRGATVRDIVNTVAITAIQAGAK